MPNYREHLQSEYWRSLKRDALDRAEGRCQGIPDGVPCETTDGLQLHHRHYRTLGHERLSDVAILCNRCHRRYASGERFTLRENTTWYTDAQANAAAPAVSGDTIPP